MNNFINDNIHSMSLNAVTTEVCDELLKEHANENGVAYDEVREHIQSHMLQPNVRMALSIRNLLDLGDRMKSELYKHDEKGNQVNIDPKLVDSYMRLHAHIASLYKLETHKMLFNQGGGTASGSSGAGPGPQPSGGHG